MMAYPGQTWMTLGQLHATLRDSQSQADVMQPGFEPGTAVIHLALRCSAFNRCATQEGVCSITTVYVTQLYQFEIPEMSSIELT